MTVSTLDGHNLRGSYKFGVGQAAAGDETVDDDPLSSEGVLGIIGRYIALAGLTLWAGAAALGRVSRRSGLPGNRLKALGIAAPIAAASGTSLSLLAIALAASGSVSGLVPLLAAESGRLRGAVVLAGILGAAAWRLRPLYVVLAAAGVIAEAASGHAASSIAPLIAIPVFALHLTALGVWVFAIAASILSKEGVVRSLVRFTRFAVAAAAVVALSGVSMAALFLNSPSELLSTGYGKVVAAKGAAFLLMAGFGAAHFIRRTKTGPPSRSVRGPLRSEAAAAGSALALAALLVAFPNPPREAASVEPLGGIDPVLLALEGREALSVAEPSGNFIVGLTLLPPVPGEVEFRIQVLGVEAGDALRDARLEGVSGDGENFQIEMPPCRAGSLGCFAGRARIPSPGQWEIEISITSNRQHIEATYLLPVPAPDGAQEFERALSSMEALESAVMEETLRGYEGQEAVVSRYKFRAPDAFAFSVRDSERIVIGDRTFRKQDGVWASDETAGLTFSWPERWFRSFWATGAAAVRLTGTDEIGGRRCREAAFVRPELPAWFRVCVGVDDGLVHRMVMYAQGHLMIQHFSGFNEPVDLEAPL